MLVELLTNIAHNARCIIGGLLIDIGARMLPDVEISADDCERMRAEIMAAVDHARLERAGTT